MPTSSQDLHSPLDAVTYFFVNSGVFILITAGIFFFLGLWLGRLIWGRYKKHLREAEAVIETFRAEVAVLKRRMAEKPKHGVTLFSHSPPLALASQPSSKGPFFPMSRMFYIWGEADWEPPAITPVAQPESHAFSEWTEPAWEPPASSLHLNSRAFSVWTESDWTPPAVKISLPPLSHAFSLWTEPDFKLSSRSLYQPGRPASLWTNPDWSPTTVCETLPKGRALTLWTQPEFTALKQILYPRSKAFSIWTEASWHPLHAHAPLPTSRAFSIWTEKYWRLNSDLPAENDQPSTGGSLFSRALAAAKNVLRIGSTMAERLDAAPLSILPPPNPVALPAVMPEPSQISTFPQVNEFPTVMETVPASPVELPILQKLPVLTLPLDSAVPLVAAMQPDLHHVETNTRGWVHHDDLPGVAYNNKDTKTDDLTLLKGIGVVIQHQLNGMGVYTFKQIALWTKEQAEEISQRLAFKDRVFREHWIDQAREWHYKTHGEML